MKSILIIHQSSELYGSDKTILFFARELDKTKYFPVVILPSEGPLKTEFEKTGIKVVIAPVLKVYRDILHPKNILQFLKEYSEGKKILAKLHAEYDFKLIYSHTLAVMIGWFFAKSNKIKHLWHVQEIIEKPTFVNKAFKKLLSSKSNHKAIYDSIQTMKFWIEGQPELTAKSDAVWNGLDVSEIKKSSAAEIETVRKDFFEAETQNLVIGLIGRINGWKGQQLLLEAFDLITDEFPESRLVFIGSSPPNQDYFTDELQNKIRILNISEKVRIIPFQKNISLFWESIDIAVVPSTQPEPFGMVAIEAMAAKKPVIAANHGGLTEIVLPAETGFLFEPGNKDDLAKYLKMLLQNPDQRKSFGEKGFERVNEVFSMKNHTDKIEKIFEELI